MKYNEKIKDIKMPKGIAGLPVSASGFPTPWFVAVVDGVADFRVVDQHKMQCAIIGRQCFICGLPLGRFMCFPIGPMCSINRISAEPPSHYECARYAIQACPFLSQPRMRRNEKDLPADHVQPAGVMIPRNPGVTCLWVTRDYKVMGNFRQGMLFKLGRCEAVEWYAEGRRATRSEVEASIESGLPSLLEACDQEATPAIRALAHRQLRVQVKQARRLLPPPEREAAE